MKGEDGEVEIKPRQWGHLGFMLGVEEAPGRGGSRGTTGEGGVFATSLSPGGGGVG